MYEEIVYCFQRNHLKNIINTFNYPYRVLISIQMTDFYHQQSTPNNLCPNCNKPELHKLVENQMIHFIRKLNNNINLWLIN